MIHLSAFADEISPDLNEQIAVLSLEHIRFLDLRRVENTNVLDLTDQQVARINEDKRPTPMPTMRSVPGCSTST